MTSFALQLLDDAVTRYSLHAGDQQIGEIRYREMHACVLHLGEQRLLLVEDDVAAVAVAGGSLLRRFVHKLRFNRGYSLRDGEQALARARRHWNPLRNQDWIECWPHPEAAALHATPRGMLMSGIDLTRDRCSLGEMHVVGLQQHRITLTCAELDPPRAAFLMYVVHRVWGNNPYLGAS